MSDFTWTDLDQRAVHTARLGRSKKLPVAIDVPDTSEPL